MRAATIGLLLGISLVAARTAVPAELSLTHQAVSIPEAGFVTNLILHTARYDFSFNPPRLWKLGIDTNTSTLTFQPANLRSVLHLRLLKDRVIPGSSGHLAMLEQKVRERFPAAEIKGHFPAYCASHSGTGFALEERRPLGGITIRLAYFAYADAMVELELRCPQEDFPRIQYQFNSMLNSLRILPRRDG